MILVLFSSAEDVWPNEFVTDGHFQKSVLKFVWRPVKNKWFDDGLLYDLLLGLPLRVPKVCTIWLPWLLIFMRIQEMFNVSDGRDRNFGVDFLLLFVDFYLKSSGSRTIFNYRC